MKLVEQTEDTWDEKKKEWNYYNDWLSEHLELDLETFKEKMIIEVIGHYEKRKGIEGKYKEIMKKEEK